MHGKLSAFPSASSRVLAMSNDFVKNFNEPHMSDRPNDLLARLYREIGLSAVAAALDVMAHPSEPERKMATRAPVPAILEEELAA